MRPEESGESLEGKGREVLKRRWQLFIEVIIIGASQSQRQAYVAEMYPKSIFLYAD